MKNKDFFLDALIVGAKYKENNLSKIIHSFKYNLIQDLYIPLGKVLVKAFSDNDLPLPDAIIPIPLHKRRLRWRGFNQSELLANHISESLTPGMEIPVINNTLVRKKYTTPQMKVKKYSERKENIKDVFEVCSVKSARGGPAKQEFNRVKNKKILLVDDIATTGATLNECAKILKLAGAKKVFGLVLARQEIKRIT